MLALPYQADGDAPVRKGGRRTSRAGAAGRPSPEGVGLSLAAGRVSLAAGRAS